MQPKYKYLDNKFFETKPHFYDRLISVQTYQYKYNYIWKRSNNDTAIRYFKDAMNLKNKHWPDTEFVIILYPTNPEISHEFDDDFVNNLKNLGFKVINLEEVTKNEIDLTDDKNKVDGFHPSAQVWDILLPKIIKILGIE